MWHVAQTDLVKQDRLPFFAAVLLASSESRGRRFRRSNKPGKVINVG